jgi:hypothetical protein
MLNRRANACSCFFFFFFLSLNPFPRLEKWRQFRDKGGKSEAEGK